MVHGTPSNGIGGAYFDVVDNGSARASSTLLADAQLEHEFRGAPDCCVS